MRKARALLATSLVWVTKTALIRNSYVFTVNVVDNECLIAVIQAFSSFEIDQYSSLFERYSRSAKTLSLNLQIYCMICRLLRTLVNCMNYFFELPRNEIMASRVFSLTIPPFLQMVSEQLNIFIITRATELHNFPSQLCLIDDYMTLLATMMEFNDDAKLKELFHSFSVGFLPQSIFYLAQSTSLHD